MCIATWLWLTSMSLTNVRLGQEIMVTAMLPFFPAFCSVYSVHLRAVLSKGQGSFFIQPMKAMQIQKNLLYQYTHVHAYTIKEIEVTYLRESKGLHEKG